MKTQEKTLVPTKCSNCQEEVGGYIVSGLIFTTDDVVRLMSGAVNRETVNGWFGQGYLRGFKLPGQRSWVAWIKDVEQDLKALPQVLQRAPKMAHEGKEVVGHGR